MKGCPRIRARELLLAPRLPHRLTQRPHRQGHLGQAVSVMHSRRPLSVDLPCPVVHHSEARQRRRLHGGAGDQSTVSRFSGTKNQGVPDPLDSIALCTGRLLRVSGTNSRGSQPNGLKASIRERTSHSRVIIEQRFFVIRYRKSFSQVLRSH
jgi:hypothetical protein